MTIKKLLTAVAAAVTLGVCAAPSNPNPANYATVDTHTPTLKTWLAKSYSDKFFKASTTGSAARIALGNDYKTNGIVRLSWSGTSGSCTVKVVRMSDGYEQNFTTSAGYVDLLAPEIGRNYKWTVTNGGSSSTWYFYTDGAGPRIIPQQLAVVGNCRDIGGWATTDGKRVRQGFGYRNDHNADFYQYSVLKPFWTDIAHIKTDMDLRDDGTSYKYYYLWELDGNDSPGRSPYGANWWEVFYWNVMREGSYGGYMLAYKTLIDKLSSTSRQGSQKTWKQFADAARLPIVVHCSQGRDRTGTVCFVLLGALGVPLDDLYSDWAMTDYAAPKDFPQGSSSEGQNLIVPFYNAIKSKYPDSSYPTLKDKCVALLKALGLSDAELQNLRSYLLEPVEPKLTAAPSKTSVTVPTLAKSAVVSNGAVQKPTITANSQYTVDYGGGNYKDYGKYLITVTLKDPAHYQWSDGTFGPKVLSYCIQHNTNIYGGNVRSFIKGDTASKIMITRPRYQGQVSCSYTEEQLNNLAPGTYEATITAYAAELVSKTATSKCKFTVYPATEKASYTYEYADVTEGYFRTDYVPSIQTDKIEIRLQDKSDGVGGGYFGCSSYPSSFAIFKLSAGEYVYYQGAQNCHVLNNRYNWPINSTIKLTAYGKTGTFYEESSGKTYTSTVTLDKIVPTPGPAFIGCGVDAAANRGAEGVPGYHAPFRLYHAKSWANGSTLAHEFVPCKTTGNNAMLYDKVTKKLYPFSHSLGKTGTLTLGGTATKVEGSGDPDPVDPPTPSQDDPTSYGAVDNTARTYTWKGFSGPWAYTTNWTASTGATYGIPNQINYATATFPSSLAGAFTCKLADSAFNVKNVNFDSPNMTLELDNATLTVSGVSGVNFGAYNFGSGATGSQKIIFKGANPGIVETTPDYVASFGAHATGATGLCTLRFVVPAANWSQAPIRTASTESKVWIRYNVKFEIDATALGVPAAGDTVTVPLATGAKGVRFYSDNFAEIVARSTIGCVSGAQGELAVEGMSLVLKVTRSGSTPTVQPVPEPTVTSTFDADHTIICYGDSLTWGAEAPEVTMDSRANFHDGRLAGVAGVPKSYPWWLSSFVPSTYNVISQSRSGSQTCNITSWSGEQAVTVKSAFTLPATGSVSLHKNFVFKDCAWGEWGGWAAMESGDQDVQDRWGGFVTPIFPLYEAYNETTPATGMTRYSITGTLAGRHVRLQGIHPTNITVTVFGSGSAQNVAAGTVFTPDNAVNTRFSNAIRILCAGANDGGKTRYTTHIKPLMQAFAAKGGKYIITTSWEHTYGTGESVTQLTPTAMEADMASTFGDHFLNIRMALATNGLATAVQLGVLTQAQVNALSGWSVRNGQGLFCNNSVHFTAAGNAVFAEIIRRKLVSLGYITEGTDPEPPVVDPTQYGAMDKKAATYTWKGNTAPWEYTTSWTASSDATYGIPNNSTNATANFSASLSGAFTATVGANITVKNLNFDAPNGTLRLDNHSLTVTDWTGDTALTWGAFNFANSATGNSAVEISGANGALIATRYSSRLNLGYVGSGTATGTCTIRYTVPAAGWTTAPIRATGNDMRVCFGSNVILDIDATAIAAPTGGATVTVPLAQSLGKAMIVYSAATTNAPVIRCASGAKGELSMSADSKLLSLVITADDTPVVDPEQYGAVDNTARTYTWKGDTALWKYTTSWTPSSGATYGIPNNANYATADFPASLAAPFTATIDSSASVRYANFNSPKMTLKIDNATLTVKDAVVEDTYNASVFAPSADADSTLEFTGANPGLVLQRAVTRQYFGYRTDATSATGEVTIKFTVPAANWANAPIRVTGGDSKFLIGYNVKFVIDATALGVPAEGSPVTVPLVSTTDGIRACNGDTAGCVAAATVLCANGASGVVSISGNNIVLTLTRSEGPGGFAIIAPVENATGVPVVRPGHTEFFAMDRDARWAAVDNATYRNAMVETSSFPQEVDFSWEGGTAPFTFTLTRTRDSQVVKTVSGVTTRSLSVGNLEIGRAYTWQVTDAVSATISGAFTTAYADQRFLKVGATNSGSVVSQYSSAKSAGIHANSIPNFRDLGGMFTADGTKRVKQNLVFRSFGFDRPGSAGYESLGADLAVVTGELGIRTDLDLRNQSETGNVRAHGSSPLGTDVAWINCQISAYDADALGEAEEQALRVFLDTSKLPLVFHCSAGQDRTGTLAMLLGAILDLDEEDLEKGWSASCFFQNAMDVPGDDGFQTHRIKRFFGSYAKYGAPGDTLAACVRNAIKAKTTLTDADFATIRANLLETDTEVVRPVKAAVDVPDPNAIAREYDGSAQTTYLRSNNRYTVSMTDSAVLPGSYDVTLALVDPTVNHWADSSTANKTVQFTITGDGPSIVTPEPVLADGILTFAQDTLYLYTGSQTYDPTKAVFEPGAKIVVESGSNVEIRKAYLEGAGNEYVAEGQNTRLVLTPFQSSLVNANTSIAFRAHDGATVGVDLNGSDRWEFNKAGMAVALEADGYSYLGFGGIDCGNGTIAASITDSTIKFNTFAANQSGSVIALTNSSLKTNWNVDFNAGTLVLAGICPQVRSSGGSLTVASGVNLALAPELTWPADEGRIHSPATGAAQVTLASGARFEIDVSAFSGITTNFTFCLISAPTTTKARSFSLPADANVSVVGKDAENCTVTFTKDADNRNVYVTIASTSAIPEPVIGGEGGAAIEQAGSTLNVRVSNLVSGRTYGCKYSDDLLLPDEQWEVIWFTADDYEIDENGEAVMPLPKGEAPARFYRIIVE